MPVIFKGGTSGDRNNYTSGTPSSGTPQPVVDTSHGNSTPSTVHFQAESFRPYEPQTATPDFMPSGGVFPDSGQDVIQTDIANMDYCNSLSPSNVFRGAPNTGTKGGPAGPGN